MIAALDIGSTKIGCMIARVEQGGGGRPHPHVIGFGQKPAAGIRAGAVVDLEEAASAVAAAVDQAETMADRAIREIHVTASGGEPVSSVLRFSMETGGAPVDERHTATLLARAMEQAVPPEGYELVHALPIAWGLDDGRRTRDPLGLVTDTLHVSLAMVSVRRSAMANLIRLVETCHLNVADVISAPYAGALATLSPDERELGAILIDMGGGVTSVSVFGDGALAHVAALKAGGQNVTLDIARGLATPLAQAERIKTLYGSALPSIAEDRETIDVPQLGEDDGDSDGVHSVPRSYLTGIIRPRIEETFELIAQRLARAGLEDGIAGRRVVLTGGASQLTGVREVAQRVLGRQVRLGRPPALRGAPDMARAPGFAALAGTLSHALEAPPDAHDVTLSAEPRAGAFGVLTSWLRKKEIN